MKIRLTYHSFPDVVTDAVPVERLRVRGRVEEQAVVGAAVHTKGVPCIFIVWKGCHPNHIKSVSIRPVETVSVVSSFKAWIRDKPPNLW